MREVSKPEVMKSFLGCIFLLNLVLVIGKWSTDIHVPGKKAQTPITVVQKKLNASIRSHKAYFICALNLPTFMFFVREFEYICTFIKRRNIHGERPAYISYSVECIHTVYKCSVEYSTVYLCQEVVHPKH
jgi:hypothetical protein